ncbi:MAG: hypothetical protein AAFO95_01035 [Cyanobacteria bacterium J06600_6]
MAEDNKPSSTAAKATTGNGKTTPAKTTAKTGSTSKAGSTKKEGEEQSLALSTQPRTLLPQNRPIEPSHLEVVNTYSSVGSNRPVTKGEVEFSSSLAISGNRPIAASTLQVSDSFIMGNRPIASNEADDTAVLMGYLD